MLTGHKIGVHSIGAFSAFGNCPDDEALPAAHIARSEYLFDCGAVRACVVAEICLHVAPRIELQAGFFKLFNHAAFLRAQEPHGEQHQIGL